MDIKEKYQVLLKKLSELKNINENKFTFSKILIFREYQSRLYDWKVAAGYDGHDFFNKRNDYHNLFLDINPIWLDELIDEKQIVQDLDDLGLDFIRSGFREFSGFFMYLYINWEIFKDRDEVKIYGNLLNPYEMLYHLFCRGGRIYRSDNKFEINEITYLKYDNDFKLPSTDDRFLDFIDKLSNSFPNQEKVNQLWEQFKQIEDRC